MNIIKEIRLAFLIILFAAFSNWMLGGWDLFINRYGSGDNGGDAMSRFIY